MSDDWHKRYDAAQEEACVARLAWNEAEQAMARANASRHNAERALDAIFRERMDHIDSGWRNPQSANIDAAPARVPPTVDEELRRGFSAKGFT